LNGLRESGKPVWVAVLLTGIGALIGIVGVAFVWMYIQEGIIVRIGEPDQSLAFWYLPVFFIGLGAGTAGLLLFIGGLKRLGYFRRSQ
jgi:hypothetical protein